ncbi:hypothetical protein [Corynebacterium jeikeium]|nr:hypothetical protein [Corynebacterium jeikeium]
MTTLIIICALAAVAGLQYFLPRFGPNILGAVIPILFAVAAVILLMNNGVDRIRDILLPLAGFFALLCIWGGAIEAKKAKTEDEMEKIDRQIS